MDTQQSFVEQQVEGWDGRERRLFERSMTDLIEAAVEKVVAREFVEHEHREIKNIESRISKMTSEAFPQGALGKHREYHQSLIDAAEADKLASQAKLEFYETAKSKVLEKGIEGVISAFKALLILGVVLLLYRLGIAIPEWMIR